MIGGWCMSWILRPALLVAGLLAMAGVRAEAGKVESTTVQESTTSLIQLATLAGQALEPARLLITSLGGVDAGLLLATAQAHAMQALHAVDPARAAWRDVAQLAQLAGNPRAQMRAIEQQAEMNLMLSDYAGVSRQADALIALARREHANNYEASAHGYYGVVARRRGDLDAALEHYTLAIGMLRHSGDEFRLALMIGNLGTVFRDRGDFARALELQLESLAIRERIGDHLETTLRNIALLYREIEDEDNARNYFERALAAVDRHANPERYASVIGSYASLLNDVGDHAAALGAAREALAIDSGLGNRANQGLERLEIGRALHGLDEDTEATEQLESALEIGRRLGQHEIVARALLSLAEINQIQHNSLRARGMIDEAIAGLETALLRPQLARAYALREKIALADRDPATALRFLRLYSEQRELLIGTRASRQLGVLQARHARAEADKDLALLQKDNELQAVRIDKQDAERQLGMVGLIGLLLALFLISWRFQGMRQLNAALRLKNDEIDAKSQALALANLHLEQRASELYRAAISDPLTGVHNRSHLRELIEDRIAHCGPSATPLAVLLIDFDHFKQINDQLGHLHGDRVLLAGVASIRGCLRSGDILGRFGGEEFVVMLEGARALAAVEVAERVRAQVQLSLAGIDTGGIAVTVSVGIALLADLAKAEQASVDALLDAGDRAMYLAKAAGRNRIARFSTAAAAHGDVENA